MSSKTSVEIRETSVSPGYTETQQAVNDRVKAAVESVGFYTFAEERKLLRKVDLHLMPLLIMLYLLKNLDSNNVSYLTTLNTGTSTNVYTELNMTANDWAWVSTIYFIPFVIFEIPSTMLMKKTTPRVHLFRIAFLWGAATACQAAVKDKHGLYALRFVLGLFEAGMYPGQLTLLTYWYRPDEITTRMAFLGVLGSFSNVLTAFITYGFSFASGKAGLSAWQWVFLIEGVFTVAYSFVILFLLPNYPDDSKWISDEEKAYILARLPPTSPKATDGGISWAQIKGALKKPTLVLFTCLKLFQTLGTYGLAFWLPSIIQGFGITSAATSPLMTVPSAAMSVISGIVFSYSVDRAIVKSHQIALFSLTVSFGSFLVLMLATKDAVLYAFIIIATLASSADGSVLSSWLNLTLEGSTEVGFSMAFSNSIAQLGGIIGPQIFRSRYAPRYRIPYAVCVVFIGLGVIAAVTLWRLTRPIVSKTFAERKIRLRERSEDLSRKPVYNSSSGNPGEITEKV